MLGPDNRLHNVGPKYLMIFPNRHLPFILCLTNNFHQGQHKYVIHMTMKQTVTQVCNNITDNLDEHQQHIPAKRGFSTGSQSYMTQKMTEIGNFLDRHKASRESVHIHTNSCTK